MFHSKSNLKKPNRSVLRLGFTAFLALSLIPFNVHAQGEVAPTNLPELQTSAKEDEKNENENIDALLKSIGEATEETEEFEEPDQLERGDTGIGSAPEEGIVVEPDDQRQSMELDAVTAQDAIDEIAAQPSQTNLPSVDDNIFFDAQDLKPRTNVTRTTENPAPENPAPKRWILEKIRRLKF